MGLKKNTHTKTLPKNTCKYFVLKMRISNIRHHLNCGLLQSTYWRNGLTRGERWSCNLDNKSASILCICWLTKKKKKKKTRSSWAVWERLITTEPHSPTGWAAYRLCSELQLLSFYELSLTLGWTLVIWLSLSYFCPSPISLEIILIKLIGSPK